VDGVGNRGTGRGDRAREVSVPERRLLDDAHALVLGVSSYLHVSPLPPAVRDGAGRLAEVLADPHHGGYPRHQIRSLFDGDVTRQAVLEELEVLAATAGPESTLFLYFSGHGGRAGDGTGCTYLLPVDADDASPATLAATAISGVELAEALAAIPAGRMLVVFDCCHAGGLGSAGTPRSLVGGLPDSYCEALGAGHGRVVLASSRADERSWLTDAESPTVFTRHLLAALRGGAGAGDGWLRVWELFEYLQPRVTGDRPDQHPVFKADLEENFPVALALGGQGMTPDDASEDPPYHAYVSYADREPDASFVWDTLVPRLEAAGLDIAVSGDVEDPGVYRVVGVERGIDRARRTVVVLSQAYLENEMTGFIDALAQTRGIEEGFARLVPVHFGDVDPSRLPARLRMLVSLDLGHPKRGPRNFNRLVKALHAPVTPRLRSAL